MAKPIQIFPLGLPSPSNDIVHFRIAVPPMPCLLSPGSPLAKLYDLQTNGISLPISKIVVYAGMHFANTTSRYGGVTAPQAMTTLAWTLLSAWNPQAVSLRSGVKKMVVEKLDNSRLQGTASELFAVGVGLHLAKELYSVPFRLWSPSSGLASYDYWTYAPGGGKIRLEVRGRFNGRNVPSAVGQIEKKFKGSNNYSKALGVIFSPKDHLSPRAPDVWLIDPDNDPKEPPSPTNDYRMLLMHYAPFFELQGFYEFADRMRSLAGASERVFREYLAHGDGALDQGLNYRTSFNVGGSRFMGTAFYGTRWPDVIVGAPKKDFEGGAFMWGLHQEVITALKRGDLERVLRMRVSEFFLHNGPYVNFVFDDGSALAWAPNVKSLLKHP